MTEPVAATAGTATSDVGVGVGAGSGPAAETASAAAQYTYLDVHAVRIQEWLGRTPSLKFRRGASILLSEQTKLTADSLLRQSLPDLVSANGEAGEVDGVLALRWPVDEVTDPGQVTAMVVKVLRETMPNLSLRAEFADGDSYVDARQVMAEQRAKGRGTIDLPAPGAELVLAKSCDECRLSPVEFPKREVVDKEFRDLFRECCRRLEAAGGTKGENWDRSPRPEQRMRDALAERGHEVAFPDHFYAQALGRRRAPQGEKVTDTHLALIYADGNRLGHFLRSAAEHAQKRGAPRKSEIVTAVDGATIACLAGAVQRVLIDGATEDDDPREPAVLAHLAGGDDLLISVRAKRAWPFAIALAEEFEAALRAVVQGWGMPVEHTPTLSLGVVFHHYTHPFNDVVAKAAGELKNAKRATRGECATIAFLDLTADGERAPQHRQPRTCDWVREHSDRLDKLAAAPEAHRRTLIDLHRESCADTPGEHPDDAARRRADAAATLARKVCDRGHPAVVEVVGDRDLARDEAARDELRGLLDIARHWPKPLSSNATDRSEELS